MNRNEAEHLADTINGWDFPYVHAYVSSLGGAERSSVLATISLDPRSSWTNGILQNSRYAVLSFHSGPGEEVRFKQVSGHRIKLRSWSTKDKAALYKKLNSVAFALRLAENP